MIFLNGISHVVITELDDLKFDPFGTSAVSSLGSYDWSDKEDLPSGQGKKLQGGLPSSAVVQRKETSFGSSENITHTTVAKVTTFPIEDGGSTTESRFEAFADFGSIEQAGQDDDDDDFGDFASMVSEKSNSPPGTTEAEGNQGELTDEFGAFQGDKPKFGKSDFLKASTQAKVKSSEEMIKNELATFDLSVQGKCISVFNTWILTDNESLSLSVNMHKSVCEIGTQTVSQIMVCQ